jgi:hypothetical protein
MLPPMEPLSDGGLGSCACIVRERPKQMSANATEDIAVALCGLISRVIIVPSFARSVDSACCRPRKDEEPSGEKVLRLVLTRFN